MRSIPLLVAALLVAAPAAAQTPSAADVLFEEGRAALAAGNLDVACTKFAESDRLDPAAGTRGSLGECEERRGRVASAWHAYRTALDVLPPGDARGRVIEQRMAKLRPRIPHLVLTLRSGPWDTIVREGGTTVGDRATFGVPVPLDPGSHHLEVTAPGRAPVSVEVTLVEGQTTQLGISAGPELAAPTAPVSPPPPVLPPPVGTPPVRPAVAPEPPARAASPGPWILGGLGVAGLVVGAVAGGLTVVKKGVTKEHCNDATRTCDAEGLSAAKAGRTLGPVSTVGLVVGGLALGAGVAWYLVDRPSQRVAFKAAVLSGGAGIGTEGTW